MKILVTGGAGFIASHIVDKYIELGHEVIVIDDLSSGSKDNINPDARFYGQDIRFLNSIHRIIKFEKPQIINHHAAQISVPESVTMPNMDLSINVQGTINLLEAARDNGVQRFIFASSGGAIYGEAEEFPTTESYPPNPQSPYAIHKLAAELHIQAFQRNYGLDFVILRYSNVYGPRQTRKGEAGVISIFIEQLLNKQACTINVFDGESAGMIRDYCYVGDVVRINCRVLNLGRNEIYNIGTRTQTATFQLYDIILNALQKIKPEQDFASIVPYIGPPRDGDIRRSCLSNLKASKELGWKSKVSMIDGIEETVKWWINLRNR